MNRVEIILRHDSFRAQKSKASPSKHLASPNAFVKLSKSIDKSVIMDKSMNAVEENAKMLNLQNQFIEELDRVPAKYKRINTLILSNNHLKTLRGIEQFPRLKKLVAVENELDDILNVYYLLALPVLEELDLRGNRIVNMPNYRDTILLFSPSLKILDGKTVKPAERDKVQPEVKRQYSLLEKLLENYIELIKLQSVVKKLDLHKELFNKDRRFIMNFVPFKVTKFKKMFSYFNELDEKVRNDFRTDLLRDVHTIEVNVLQRDDMESAAQELSSRQQAKIKDLTKQIEKKASVLESVYKANIDKLNRFGIRDDSYIVSTEPIPEKYRKFRSPMSSRIGGGGGSPGILKSGGKFLGDMKSFRSNDTQSPGVTLVDQTFRSQKTAREFEKKVIITKGEPRSQNQSKILSKSRSRGIVPESSGQSPDIRYDFTLAVGHKKGLSLSKLPGSPAKRGNKILNDNLNTEEDVPMQLNISHAEVAKPEEIDPDDLVLIPKEAVIEKEREISDLARSLSETIERVVKVGNVNKQLKDKLREFEEQNQTNTRQVQDIVNSILQETKTTTEGQEALEKELNMLRQTIEQLKKKNIELDEDRESLERENSKLMVFKEEVYIQQIGEEKEDFSVRHHNRILLHKGFELLRRAVYRSKIVEEMHRNNRELEAYSTQEKVFTVLKRAMLIKRIGQHNRRTKEFILVKDVFESWRNRARKGKIVKYLRDKRNSDLMFTALACWSHYREIKLNQRSIREKLDGFCENKLLRKVIEGFKLTYKFYRHEKEVEEQFDEVATSHQEQRIIRKSFINWRDYIKDIGIPKKLKKNMANIAYKNKLETLGFRLIKANFQFYQQAYENAGLLRAQRNLRIQREVFGAWNTDFRVAASIQREEKRLQELFFLRRSFNFWRKEFFNKRQEDTQASVADSHYLNHLVTKYFNNLYIISTSAQKRRSIFEQLKKKKSSTLVKSCYKKWRNAFTQSIKTTKREALYALQTERETFDRWIEFVRQQKEENLLISKSLSLYERGWMKKIASIFNAWRRYNKRSKHSKEIVKNWEQRKIRKIYKKVFWEFRLNRLRNLKERHEESSKNYCAEKSLADKNLEELNELDRERAEIIDQIDELGRNQEEVAEEIQKKGKILEKCKEQVKTKEEAIGKLEKETMDKEREVEKLERENKRINEGLQKRTREAEKTNNEYVEERDKLNEELLTLERELDNKARDAEISEREKRALSDELEEIVSRNEEIIEALCKELREAKGSLIIKEQESREATELIGEFEVRNKGLKEQVEDTLTDIERSNVTYSIKIKEFELEHEMLLDQMRILDIQNEKQIETIREMKGIIKDYEHEVGLIAEQQHRDTEEFIRKLQRGRITTEANLYTYSEKPSNQNAEGNGKGKEEEPKRNGQNPSSLVKVTEEGSELLHTEGTEEKASALASKSPKHEATGERTSTAKTLMKSLTIPIQEENKSDEASISNRNNKYKRSATENLSLSAEKIKESKKTFLETLKKRNKDAR